MVLRKSKLKRRKTSKQRKHGSEGHMAYYYRLKKQVKNRKCKSHKLPKYFISKAQKHYKTDLKKVRYYYPIRIANNVAITFGKEIFFPSKPNFHWMLHELQHCDQYKRHGESMKHFLVAYQRQSDRNPRKKYNVFEDEAEDRADELFKILKELCDKPFPCKD
jgi:hypothetical protein